MDPIVIIYIIAKIITFLTKGKSLPNCVYLLSEIHGTTVRDMKKYLNIGSEFIFKDRQQRQIGGTPVYPQYILYLDRDNDLLYMSG